MNTIKKNDFIAISLFFAVVTLFFYPVIFTGKTFFFRDLTYIFHPWRTLTAEMVQKGDVPLWNSYAYCGMPLMANWQSAVFYPFTILFYLFSFPFALKIYYFLHILTAGLFAYLFGRKNNLSLWASVGMMLLFSMNGYIITKLEFLSYIGVISWTFALLLLLRMPLLLAIAICFSFTSGHQVFMFQITALIIYLLFESIHENYRMVLLLKNIIIAGFVSIWLISCQLLPTLELLNLSYRAKQGIDFGIATLNSLKFSDLPKLISPHIFKATSDLVSGEVFQWGTTMFIGITGIIVVLYRIFVPLFDVKKLCSLFLIILGIIFAMGNSTPVYPWLYRHFFIFHVMRYPVQYVYFSMIGFTMLFGQGLNNLKYKYLVVIILSAELLLTSANFQPLAPDAFYGIKSRATAFLQNNLDSNRFLLSPGTEKNRYVSGKDFVNAWQNARGYLYNLTCLPYHTCNAYGFGEPLTLASIEYFIDKAYSQKTAQASIPFFNDMGVKYLLCRNKLVNSTGYNLVENHALYIYQLKKPPEMFSFLKPERAFAKIVLNKPGKLILDIETPTDNTFIWKESFYPGWKTYVNNTAQKVSSWNSLFRQWELPKGKYYVYHIYRPTYFYFGIMFTLSAVIFLLFLGVRRLKKSFA